jgi:hypothetical protein
VWIDGAQKPKLIPEHLLNRVFYACEKLEPDHLMFDGFYDSTAVYVSASGDEEVPHRSCHNRNHIIKQGNVLVC